ncbi:DinB/UmuC family translesion DNA polymerase, partial [Serratia marcescens]|uniref:DinB/UmuC family translesion DNA polymerase n=1 Tax=Serratia marcescens TaxID=615 RepID=UPI002813D5BA|nr:hypothetical protein [Serratia marcescens]
REAICSYAERAAEKLRQEKRYCRNVSVFIKTSPHSAGEGYYSNMGTAMAMMSRLSLLGVCSRAVPILLTYIQAVFGNAPAERYLPFAISDRKARQ